MNSFRAFCQILRNELSPKELRLSRVQLKQVYDTITYADEQEQRKPTAKDQARAVRLRKSGFNYIRNHLRTATAHIEQALKHFEKLFPGTSAEHLLLLKEGIAEADRYFEQIQSREIGSIHVSIRRTDETPTKPYVSLDLLGHGYELEHMRKKARDQYLTKELDKVLSVHIENKRIRKETIVKVLTCAFGSTDVTVGSIKMELRKRKMQSGSKN